MGKTLFAQMLNRAAQQKIGVLYFIGGLMLFWAILCLPIPPLTPSNGFSLTTMEARGEGFTALSTVFWTGLVALAAALSWHQLCLLTKTERAAVSRKVFWSYGWRWSVFILAFFVLFLVAVIVLSGLSVTFGICESLEELKTCMSFSQLVTWPLYIGSVAFFWVFFRSMSGLVAHALGADRMSIKQSWRKTRRFSRQIWMVSVVLVGLQIGQYGVEAFLAEVNIDDSSLAGISDWVQLFACAALWSLLPAVSLWIEVAFLTELYQAICSEDAPLEGNPSQLNAPLMP